MPDTTEPPPGPSMRRRLAWFVGIAALSGLACAAVAELLRWLILH